MTTIQHLPPSSEGVLLASLIEPDQHGVLRVPSTVVAEQAEVQHKNILALVDKHHNRLALFGGVAFETRTLPTAGGTQRQRVALLTEQQATLLLTMLRNTEVVLQFKVTLVRAFYELAQRPTTPAPLSDDQIVAQALQITAARVKALEAQVQQDAPKVAYVDNFVADNDTVLFRTVASDLNVGEKELRELLQARGWIYRHQQSRRTSNGEVVTEYQWCEYAAKKPYFYRVLNHQAPLFKGSVAHTLKITPAGAAAIARLVQHTLDQHPTIQDALEVIGASKALT